MATCALMGQAIGTAASYAITNHLAPTQVGNQAKHTQSLQQLLLRQDQGILGVVNEDQKDLARKAKVTASTETADGPATAIIDGINRVVQDGKTHQWQAKIEENTPWIALKWDTAVKLNTIQLTFDTGLNRYLRISPQDWVYNKQIRGAQPETIADYTIELLKNGTVVHSIPVKNNYLRLVKHDFKEQNIDTVRIKVQKTNGDPLARIFEVRCYLD
tara:strand:- start:561 stop:1208 length:648 start_codon:yes stop_codon:yes gene_type:complete